MCIQTSSWFITTHHAVFVSSAHCWLTESQNPQSDGDSHSEHLIWAADNKCSQFPAKHTKTRLIKDLLSCYQENRLQARLLHSMKIIAGLWPKKTAFRREREHGEWSAPRGKMTARWRKIRSMRRPWKQLIILFSFCTYLWSLKLLATHRPNLKIIISDLNPQPTTHIHTLC